MNRMNPLISVIMPTFNSEKYILKSIQSVLNQTYINFELIIVDDCSTDGTKEIIKKCMLNDDRIKYFRLEDNSGVAISRNFGVEKAQGIFLSFIDSDDLWFSEKLEKQVNYMLNKGINFSCTYYDKVDESGREIGITIKNDEKISYNSLLKNNCGNSTVMYNAKELGKFFIPNIKKRNDYVMWLTVIKKAKYLYTYPEVLSSHRLRSNSLSSNKKTLIKYHWEVYRKIEKLNIFKSIYLMFYWVIYKQLIQWKK